MKKVNMLTINFIFATLSTYMGFNRTYYIIISLIGIKVLKDIICINRNRSRFNFRNISILIFIITMLSISLIFNNVPFINVLRLLIMIYNIVIVYLIICIYPKEYFVQFLKQLRNIALILGILSIFEYIFRINPIINLVSDDKLRIYLTNSLLSSDYRVVSVFAHGIVYGNYLVICFFVGKYLGFEKKSINIFYNFIIFINIYLTNSRSVWIAISLSYIIVGIFTYDNTKRMYVEKSKLYLKLGLGILLSVLVLVLFNETITNIFSSILDRFAEMNTSLGEASKLQRLGSIKLMVNSLLFDSEASILKVLFGNGYMTNNEFMLNNHVYLSNFMTTDNQYLSIMYDFGLILTIIYFIFLTKNILSIKLNCKFNNKVKILSISIIVACSINMFFYNMYAWKSLFNIYIVVVSYLLTDNKEKNTKLIKECVN